MGVGGDPGGRGRGPAIAGYGGREKPKQTPLLDAAPGNTPTVTSRRRRRRSRRWLGHSRTWWSHQGRGCTGLRRPRRCTYCQGIVYKHRCSGTCLRGSCRCTHPSRQGLLSRGRTARSRHLGWRSSWRGTGWRGETVKGGCRWLLQGCPPSAEELHIAPSLPLRPRRTWKHDSWPERHGPEPP